MAPSFTEKYSGLPSQPLTQGEFALAVTASILDRDGHDWISYRHGGKALGEYRGLPKCGQPVKFFHCGYGFGQYTNDNWFTSSVTARQPSHIRVHAQTRRGD